MIGQNFARQIPAAGHHIVDLCLIRAERHFQCAKIGRLCLSQVQQILHRQRIGPAAADQHKIFFSRCKAVEAGKKVALPCIQLSVKEGIFRFPFRPGCRQHTRRKHAEDQHSGKKQGAETRKPTSSHRNPLPADRPFPSFLI